MTAAAKSAFAGALLFGAATCLFFAAVAHGYVGFQSPSHNIGCVMTKASVRCDIAKHDWPTPPKPKSCELDYGGGVYVSKHGRAKFLCAGDTALGIGPVLPYGQSKQKGRFRCKSLETGMRCINRRNNHGFLLSRQKVRLF